MSTIPRQDIIAELYMRLAGQGRLADLKKTEISLLINTFEEIVEEILLHNNACRLGHIGTLKMKLRRGKEVWIPKTDRRCKIPDRVIPSISPSGWFVKNANR